MKAINDNHSLDYDDAYTTCERTYATLCIYLTDQSNPNTLSEELGLSPSRIQTRGEIREGRIMGWPTAWFLTTDEVIQSKDVRKHVDWLIEQLAGKDEIIFKLQDNKARLVISCFWLSSVGYGGPMLSSKTMGKLGELGIDISFDIYFDEGEDAEEQRPPTVSLR